MGSAPRHLYAGTVTRSSSSRGVYHLVLAPDGALSVAGCVEAPDPTWLVVAPDGRHLHALCHVSTHDGRPGALVPTWSLDATGAPSPAGTVQLQLTHASFGAFDRSGRWLLVACTLGGGVTTVPVGDDGILGPPVETISHAGPAMVPLGVTDVPARIPMPGSPMPHATLTDRHNRLVVVPDMGLDLLVLYRFDAAAGSLVPCGSVPMPPGAEGPRHAAFVHDDAVLIVVNELGSSVATVHLDVTAGTGEVVAVVPVEAPSGVRNKPSGIAVDVGRGLAHVANRGRDDVTTYAYDADGGIEEVGAAPCGGSEPRGLALTHEGDVVLVANETSGDVVALAVRPDGLVGAVTGRALVPGATAIALPPRPIPRSPT